MKKLVVMLLVVSMLFSSTAYATGINMGSVNDLNDSGIAKMSMEMVLDFVQAQAENVTTDVWTNETTISSIIDLYDPSGNMAGLIFDLETDGEATGYVEICFVSSTPIIKAYSYEGINAVVGQLALTDSDINPYADTTTVISLGGMEFGLKDNTSTTDEVLLVSTGNTINFIENKIAMQNYYDDNMDVLEEICAQTVNDNQIVTATYVSGGAGFSAKTTSHFANSGYVNRCAPTAGVNILKYYQERYGITLYENVNTAFEMLYNFMLTNQHGHTGTGFEHILPGMQNYFSSRNTAYSFSGSTLSPTLATIKTNINRNCPVILTATDFGGEGTGGHAVVAFGYGTVNTTPNSEIITYESSVILATGWSTALHTYVYSSVQVRGLVYIGFNF